MGACNFNFNSSTVCSSSLRLSSAQRLSAVARIRRRLLPFCNLSTFSSQSRACNASNARTALPKRRHHVIHAGSASYFPRLLLTNGLMHTPHGFDLALEHLNVRRIAPCGARHQHSSLQNRGPSKLCKDIAYVCLAWNSPDSLSDGHLVLAGDALGAFLRHDAPFFAARCFF